MTATQPNVTPDGDEDVPKAPGWLKAIVGGLGLAIVGMLVLIVVKIAAGDHQKNDSTNVQTATQAFEAVDANVLEAIDVEAPAGSALIDVTPAGREVFLRFRMENGAEEILILDRVTGAKSTIRINAPEN